MAALAAAGAFADWWSAVDPQRRPQYIGRSTCAECHREQVEAWTGSHHDLAMQEATKETVLGDFGDVTFERLGITSRMFRRDGKFFIHTEGPDGKLQDFQIKYTFGVTPLQQYMVEFPDGRVQVLRISWDTEQKRWFYVPPPDVPDERLAPDDPLHWTGVGQNWNFTCADCHSTNLQKGYDLATDTYDTTFSEIDVSCEACHGPAEIHVELARQPSLFWDRHHGYGLAKLKGESSGAELETCARCHSRRRAIHPDFSRGERLLDTYEPELLREDTYFADGQILDEVYVYGSFLQSRMFHEGVRCTDCHNPHSLKLKFEGNRLCAQCHQPGKYDTPAHHHHVAGTRGAQCVECHMPERTYMVVDPRRDHSLRVPRPDLSVRLGTPNACNGCHTKPEENAEWAAGKVVEWYGEKRPDDPHFGPALASGRQGEPEGADELLALLKRRQTPDIVKATAISLLPQYGSSATREAIEQSLSYRGTPAAASSALYDGADGLVRLAAIRGLPQQQPYRMLQLLGPLLDDPLRAVRIAAARRLVGVSRSLMSADQIEQFEQALEEFEQSELVNRDRAGAHLNLGNLYQEQGRLEQAAESFETAIRLEPYLAGPRSNLSSVYEQLQRDPADIRGLREEEVELLARDAELLPGSAITQHRYGLTLYLLGRMEEAEAALRKACELAPANYDFRLVYTLLLEKAEKWDQAIASAQTLLQIRPGDRDAQQLLRKFHARRQ